MSDSDEGEFLSCKGSDDEDKQTSEGSDYDDVEHENSSADGFSDTSSNPPSDDDGSDSDDTVHMHSGVSGSDTSLAPVQFSIFDFQGGAQKKGVKMPGSASPGDGTLSWAATAVAHGDASAKASPYRQPVEGYFKEGTEFSSFTEFDGQLFMYNSYNRKQSVVSGFNANNDRGRSEVRCTAGCNADTYQSIIF